VRNGNDLEEKGVEKRQVGDLRKLAVSVDRLIGFFGDLPMI
jgi:hypothetical protein